MAGDEPGDRPGGYGAHQGGDCSAHRGAGGKDRRHRQDGPGGTGNPSFPDSWQA